MRISSHSLSTLCPPPSPALPCFPAFPQYGPVTVIQQSYVVVLTVYNTRNPGMDNPLSSGQTPVHLGHGCVQHECKNVRILKK